MLDIAPLVVPEAAHSTFWDVHAYGGLSSTNDAVKQALREGAGEGYCVTALYQSGGYGRQGRAWASPVGGLYTSFALCPNISRGDVPSLSLVLSLAVRDALLVQVPSLDVQVKWPNDVLCAGEKICGISLEAGVGGVCVGVGINVFHPLEEETPSGKYRKAYLLGEQVSGALTGLQRATMVEVLSALLCQVEARYQGWRAFGFSAYKQEYESLLAYKACHVTMDTIDGAHLLEGTIHSVDEQGRLLIKTHEEDLVPAASGEVHITTLG